MIIPFRKISRTRNRMRRTYYKIQNITYPKCGFYKGKNVVEKEEATK